MAESGFTFAANAVRCENCPHPHGAVQFSFDFPDGDSFELTVPIASARDVSEELFKAILKAETII